MDEVTQLGPPVVEDCAHALGAFFRGRPAGSLGTISVFSLYATKVICAGDGGVVCTSDRALSDRVRDLNRPDERARYRLRYHYKMSDLTAGLGHRRRRRLTALIEQRRIIASRYRRVFEGGNLVLQKAIPGAEPTFYRFVLRNGGAAAIMREARKVGIGCDRHVFRPLHRYLKQDNPRRMSGTETVWRSIVSVPLYPDLDHADVRRIIQGIQRIPDAHAGASSAP